MESTSKDESSRLPLWLRRPPGSAVVTQDIKRSLRNAGLNTVCEEARCPNIAECFGRGTATFMILGDVCTRGCRFCSVSTGKPSLSPLKFAAEAKQLADTVESLKLKHVVITSVARDDLADGGASGFALSIAELRARFAELTIEVLIPDFRGSSDALNVVVDAGPDVLNHNLETVPRLYRRVRPGASYERSLELLTRVKERAPQIHTKTGIMLGLGEQKEEVLALMADTVAYGIDFFTAGQYMRPTRDHLPVSEYVSPELFSWYQEQALALGLKRVAFGPLVRSSYHAEQFLR